THGRRSSCRLANGATHTRRGHAGRVDVPFAWVAGNFRPTAERRDGSSRRDGDARDLEHCATGKYPLASMSLLIRETELSERRRVAAGALLPLARSLADDLRPLLS